MKIVDLEKLWPAFWINLRGRDVVKKEGVMFVEVSESAGRIYGFLRRNGEVTYNAIIKGTNLNTEDADRAITLLAHEGKIFIEIKRKKEFIALTE